MLFDGVAKRERQSSMAFNVSNAQHTFQDKIGLGMILETVRASVGKSFGSFGVLLGTLFEALILITFKGN